jgi:hypothetical protein
MRILLQAHKLKRLSASGSIIISSSALPAAAGQKSSDKLSALIKKL